MPVTRSDLEKNVLRRRLEGSSLASHLLTEAELEASLHHTLTQRPAGPDVWLFGYGSLVWNPFIEFRERRPGTIRGWHRSFCLWSRVNRGTPEQPGLALGLEPGGACRGSLFRIDAGMAEAELRILWRREMMLGSYVPRWVKAESYGESLTALTFIVNRGGPAYAGKLSEGAIVDTLVRASGLYGSGIDYLFRTVEGLHHCGIRDSRLDRLRDMALARLDEAERTP
jgi:glutathione-specific gamma-glutamylcyclotransferase